MIYEDPPGSSHSEAEAVFRSGSDEEICETLIGLALHDSDWEWVQERSIELSHHSQWPIRAVAATSLGHLARIHKCIDRPRVTARLDEMLQDEKVRGYASDALSDIAMFMRKR